MNQVARHMSWHEETARWVKAFNGSGPHRVLDGDLFMPEAPKNPLGVIPEHFLSFGEMEVRVASLAASFDRYADVGKAIPPRRIKELIDRGVFGAKLGALRGQVRHHDTEDGLLVEETEVDHG